MKKYLRQAVILLIWIALWQLAAWAIGNRILFVGPGETAHVLSAQIGTPEFWRTVLSSFLRIASGFLGAFCVGILLASFAGQFPWLREFLEPFLGFLQAVPVASFVILALIWIGSENLSVLITFLVTLPVIYRNMLEGIRQTDKELLEMAQVFRLSLPRRLLYLYRPALMPYLETGCRICLGMAWKSGVAAEVIGVPAHSIGEKLYMAKIYLGTGELFAWTFVILLVSKLSEKCFLKLLHLAARDLSLREAVNHSTGRRSGKTAEERSGKITEERSGKPPHTSSAAASRPWAALASSMPGNSQRPLHLTRISKSYQGHPVLQNLSLTLEPGHIYCLTGPSGCGKTTLLRIIMGLELPDCSHNRRPEHLKISAVFQENRLFEFLTPIKNVELVCPGKCEAAPLLAQLLEPEALTRPVSSLSGGMKRRVAISRALAAPSELVLMDEPFTGLDDAARENAIRVIRENLRGRTLLLVTHRREDAALLGGELLTPFPS